MITATRVSAHTDSSLWFSGRCQHVNLVASVSVKDLKSKHSALSRLLSPCSAAVCHILNENEKATPY